MQEARRGVAETWGPRAPLYQDGLGNIGVAQHGHTLPPVANGRPQPSPRPALKTDPEQWAGHPNPNQKFQEPQWRKGLGPTT